MFEIVDNSLRLMPRINQVVTKNGASGYGAVHVHSILLLHELQSSHERPVHARYHWHGITRLIVHSVASGDGRGTLRKRAHIRGVGGLSP